MRTLSRLLHWLFLGRAVAKGPDALAGYAARREARRLMLRLTRPRRRR